MSSTAMPRLPLGDEEQGAIEELREHQKQQLTARFWNCLPLGQQQTSESTHETTALTKKRMSDTGTKHTAVLSWAPVGIGAVVVASGLLYCFLYWFHVI
ncbi:hypothetical protein MRB53_013195 [Persea americana]|uniref:Uncharacterized protein n=1 Tax=Persea americana TaxID=3435 RepID=A0ACC2K7T0_PERAE|nr:hypothetical protein MRB53_013195 [Persea americana]